MFGVLRTKARKEIGRSIGAWYILNGSRTRAVCAYDRPGTVLSIVSHNPTRKVFSALLEFLIGQGFSFIATDELLDGNLVEICKRKGRLAWLTLDDGWKDTMENVMPEIEKHNVPLTYFISPGESELGDLWPHRVAGKAPKDLREALWAMDAEERYKTICKEVGVVKSRCLMSEADIRRLSKHELLTFENHTYSHLSCSDRPADEVLHEVRKAQATLEQWTGRTPRLMCYPFGRYTSEVDARIQKEVGLTPVKLTPGVMDESCICDIRNQFYDNMSLAENSCRVFGAWRKIRNFNPESEK